MRPPPSPNPLPPGEGEAKATAAISAVLALLIAEPAAARTLQVGPDQDYKLPSAAAALAEDGDTVSIAAGEYFDCAVWRAGHLTIEGPPGDDQKSGAVITDKACGGKAAFVIEGDGVTLRRLTFARVRVPDGNGAGIRADGRDLTVQDSRFVNDQVGILANPQGGALRISGCLFRANGVNLDGQQTHSVRAGGADLLRIEHSVFEQARGGDHIDSSAQRTELDGNRLADEGGHMTGPLAVVAGGALLLQANTITLAAGAADRPGAILATGDMDQVVVRGNTLAEPGDVPLLRNWTGQDAVVEANHMPADVAAVSDSGTTYHRWRARAAAVRDWLWTMKALARHGVAAVVHRFI